MYPRRGHAQRNKHRQLWFITTTECSLHVEQVHHKRTSCFFLRNLNIALWTKNAITKINDNRYLFNKIKLVAITQIEFVAVRSLQLP